MYLGALVSSNVNISVYFNKLVNNFKLLIIFLENFLTVLFHDLSLSFKIVDILKVKNDHRSNFSNLSNWKEEAWKKKSGLQRDSNPWPPCCRCVALPTELWSHTLGARSIYWVHISHEEWNDVKYIWNNSFLNCDCRWKWRMIIAVNFPI